LVGIRGSICAGERANGLEHPLAVAEWDAELFEITLSQIGDDPEIDGLIGKDLGVLPQSKLFEPGSRTSHRRFFARAHGAHGLRCSHPLERALVYRAIVFFYSARPL
jgi:hypothetical protein